MDPYKNHIIVSISISLLENIILVVGTIIVMIIVSILAVQCY